MAQYIHFTDPNSADIARILSDLPKCPGACFFMDISKSTEMKYKLAVQDWIRKLNNTFNFFSILNDFPDNIVKGIGDEIMLYLPEEELKKKDSFNTWFALLEEIHATLFNILHFPKKDLFAHCKVAIHYCTEVYNITFFRNANDYYGSDIDLTARLMTKSKENRIVMSESFFLKVKEDAARLGLPEDTGCLSGISEKLMVSFKGVPSEFEYRIINVK